MIVTIQPSNISGIIKAPASKSSMQRACAAALLHDGETIIQHPGYSNDDKAAISLIKEMGAKVTHETDRLVVNSNGVHPIGNKVNCGESGLGIRMFAPIIALSDQTITITGEGSLLKRPMDFFDKVFPQLNVSINSNAGRLPLQIKGPLQPRDIEIDGSLSSQFLTGLLFSYSKAAAKDVSIKVKNLKSRPYIDLTLDVMQKLGLNVPENNNYEEFYFPSLNEQQFTSQSNGSKSYTVEGDWSGGAFLLVAGCIAGNIIVEGLDALSTQADKAIVSAIQESGAIISVQSNRIEIKPPSGKLQPFQFDATECPDLFPPLVSLASYCSGSSLIKGVSRLAHKESNRGLTLQDEFGKMGIKIDLDHDEMIIHGGTTVRGTVVHSRHDHRIAMSCAIASLAANGPMVIQEAEAINKSYPDFYSDLQNLGVTLTSSAGSNLTDKKNYSE